MKSFKQTLTVLFLLLAVSAASVMAQDQAASLAVLKNPEASFLEKQNACRVLTQIATAEAIPVLAGLLGDEKLSHMARMALEPIPDPAVDVALRDALAKVKGRPVFGVIASIGVRGDTEAIPTLSGLLSNDDEAVTDAAARALGNIGTGDAAAALQSALDEKKASPRRVQSLCEGLFRCAESLAKSDQAERAQKIYDAISALDGTPHQVRTAALRGAVLTRGEEGLPLMLTALRGDDYLMFTSAIRIAIEMNGAKVTESLASGLTDLPAERQLVAIDAIGERGDPACGPGLLKLVDKVEPAVQIALVETLTRLVHAPVVPVLAKLSLAEDEDLATMARESLAGFPDPAADTAIQNLLASGEVDARILGAELIGRRDIGLALPALMKTASEDADENVKVAALKELRERAGMAELEGLIAILLGTESSSVTQAAGHALVSLCARQPFDSGEIVIEKALYGDLVNNGKAADVTEKVVAMVKEGTTSIEASNSAFGDPAKGTPKQLTIHYKADGVAARKTVAERESIKLTSQGSAPPALVEPLLTALGKANGLAKIALLRILESVGGSKSLEAIRTATADEDAAVRKNAHRALCNWPSPDALPAIKELALNHPDASLKSAALRGWLRLIPLQDASAEQKLDEVKEALALAEKKQEKWAALGALREIPLASALTLVVPCLDDPELMEESCVAAVEISGRIAGKHPAEVHAAMMKVKGLTQDKRLAGQAAKLAKQTRGK